MTDQTTPADTTRSRVPADTVSAGTLDLTGNVQVDPADLDGYAEPQWVLPTIDVTALWLTGGFTSTATQNSYATDLGVPRERQTWRPVRKGNRGRWSPGPLDQSWFRWCLVYGVDPYRDVTRDLMRAWLLFCRDAGDADPTIRRRYAAVRAWFTEMRHRGLTDTVIGDLITRRDRRNLRIAGGKPAKPTVALTMAQVRAFGVAAAHDPSDQAARNQALTGFMPATGLRAEEVCGLNRDDLYPTGPGGWPAVRVKGKGGKYRWARVPAAEFAALQTYLAERDSRPAATVITLPGQVSAAPAQPLFTTATGRRLTPGGLTAVFRRLCKLLSAQSSSHTVRTAAIELAPLATTFHLHQIRHFTAQEAARNNAQLTQISAMLGHSSIAVTQTYLDSGDDMDVSPGVIVSQVIHAGRGEVAP